MTPEDRLRALLQAEAQDHIPAGDGLAVIRQRLEERRSWRRRLAPAGALAAVVALAVTAAVVVGATDKGALDQPAHPRKTEPHATPSALSCSGGLCVAPEPVVTPPPTGITTSAPGLPVWPFTTDAEAADWQADHGTRAWAGEPVAVVQHLLSDYLRVPGKAGRRTDSGPDSATVEVTAGSRVIALVSLVRVGPDTDAPWSVTGATSTNLAITTPGEGDPVTSPLHVSGTVPGVDQSVDLRLLTTSTLGEVHAPAGADQPWTAQLTWSTRSWAVAALVGITYDGKGDLSSVALTAVRGSGGKAALPAAGSTIVTVDRGHVVTLDALTGKPLHQLSYPPAGAVDSGPDRGGRDSVVWARTGPGHCSSLLVLAGVSEGGAGVTLLEAPVLRRLPALSSGGRSLGWVEQQCGGGATTVYVRGPDAKPSTIAATTGEVVDLDVRDDGAALVQLADRALLLPVGSTATSQGKALVADSGCTVSGAAWNRNAPMAWEHCRTGWLLASWGADGRVSSRSAVVPGMSAVQHTSVNQGQVLVVLQSGRLVRYTARGLIDVPASNPLTDADW